jgi:hypothetical protein
MRRATFTGVVLALLNHFSTNAAQVPFTADSTLKNMYVSGPLITAECSGSVLRPASTTTEDPWDLNVAPNINATKHLVFDTVSSFLQHWPNTRYRNGTTVHQTRLLIVLTVIARPQHCPRNRSRRHVVVPWPRRLKPTRWPRLDSNRPGALLPFLLWIGGCGLLASHAYRLASLASTVLRRFECCEDERRADGQSRCGGVGGGLP